MLNLDALAKNSIEIYTMLLIMMALSTGIVFGFLFLLKTQHGLQLVRPELRKISPFDVWFCLIPFVGVLIAFYMVNAVAASLRRQFDELGQADRQTSYGLISGRFWILLLISALFCYGFSYISPDPALALSVVLLYVSFGFWVAYFSQINDVTKKLAAFREKETSQHELDFDDESDA